MLTGEDRRKKDLEEEIMKTSKERARQREHGRGREIKIRLESGSSVHFLSLLYSGSGAPVVRHCHWPGQHQSEASGQ